MWTKLNPDPFRVYGSQDFHLGARALDYRGHEYMFCKIVDGGGGADDRRCYAIPDDFTCGLMNNTRALAGRRAGFHLAEGRLVAPASADNPLWMWLCIYGTGNIGVRQNCQAHSDLYTSGKSGLLDDHAGGRIRVHRVFLVANHGAGDGRALGVWHYPGISP